MLRELTSYLFARVPVSIDAVADRLGQERKQHVVASEHIDASQLQTDFPPQIGYARKRLLFNRSLARDLSGEISIQRYGEFPLPVHYRPYLPRTEVAARPGFFRYVPTEDADDWHVNFAHRDLFQGYGQFMFAQDEIQVAEHPALASLRELMLTRNDRLRPLAVEKGSPTPVLFRNVQRTINIDSRPIYGSRFARAEESTIRECVRLLEPPTASNILAIEAPVPSGNKIYTRPEIEVALKTAYSGMRAVVVNSFFASLTFTPTTLHTGNWGCGAYGGNRQLMISIQIMAARLAGISRIVFYCGTEGTGDISAFDSDLKKRFRFRPGASVERVVNNLVSAQFAWGRSDGN